MSRYLLLYHGVPVPEDKAKQKARQDVWENFASEISNTVVDGGRPLVKAKSFTQDNVVSNDGHDITGYTVVEATDLDEAIELSRGAPELNQGGHADVYRIVDNIP